MFPEGPDINLFLYFINKILYPVVILKSEDEIELFRDTSKEWVENTPFYVKEYKPITQVFSKFAKVTRVIAFVDPKEFKDELKQLDWES